MTVCMFGKYRWRTEKDFIRIIIWLLWLRFDCYTFIYSTPNHVIPMNATSGRCDGLIEKNGKEMDLIHKTNFWKSSLMLEWIQQETAFSNSGYKRLNGIVIFYTFFAFNNYAIPCSCFSLMAFDCLYSSANAVILNSTVLSWFFFNNFFNFFQWYFKKLFSFVNQIHAFMVECFMKSVFKLWGIVTENHRMNIKLKRDGCTTQFSDTIIRSQSSRHPYLVDILNKWSDIGNDINVPGSRISFSIQDVFFLLFHFLSPPNFCSCTDDSGIHFNKFIIDRS